MALPHRPRAAEIDPTRLVPSVEARDLARSVRSHLASLDLRADIRSALRGEGVADRWSTWMASGYLDVGLPEERDGVGDLTDLVVLLEEGGRAFASDGLLASHAAFQAQLAAGLDPSSLRLGRRTWAHGVGRVGDGRLTLTGLDALEAELAEEVTILLDEGDRCMVVAVPTQGDGVRLARHRRDHDPGRPLVTVSLDRAAVVAATAVSRSRFEAARSAVRSCVAADLVGLADEALRRSIEHALQRRQFGRSLAEMQAVKHQLADVYVLVEKARSLTAGTAAALSSEPAGRRTAQLSLMAGAAAVRAAKESAARYVQLLGAMGVTFEADAHLFFRRAHQTALCLETPDAADRRVADLEVATW